MGIRLGRSFGNRIAFGSTFGLIYLLKPYQQKEFWLLNPDGIH